MSQQPKRAQKCAIRWSASLRSSQIVIAPSSGQFRISWNWSKSLDSLWIVPSSWRETKRAFCRTAHSVDLISSHQVTCSGCGPKADQGLRVELRHSAQGIARDLPNFWDPEVLLVVQRENELLTLRQAADCLGERRFQSPHSLGVICHRISRQCVLPNGLASGSRNSFVRASAEDRSSKFGHLPTPQFALG